jgi:hypothetical protein
LSLVEALEELPLKEEPPEKAVVALLEVRVEADPLGGFPTVRVALA